MLINRSIIINKKTQVVISRQDVRATPVLDDALASFFMQGNEKVAALPEKATCVS